MALSVDRTPVGGQGPGSRLVLGAFVALVATVAGIAILGRDLLRVPIDARPTPHATEAVVASEGAAADPTSAASVLEPSPMPEPSATPEPTVPPTPRGGVPVTATAPAVALVEPSAFVGPGLEIISPNNGSLWRAVAGFDGAAWGQGNGRLVRIDAATGGRRTWTIADDARFSVGAVFPARSGGVWIGGHQGVRRFDGTRFREGYQVADPINAGIEAPDGTIWLALGDQSLLHIVDGVETRIDTLAPSSDAGITSIEIDRTGGVWCAWARYGDGWGWGSSEGWFTRYDGRSWSVIDTSGFTGLQTPAMGLAVARDGSVWATTNEIVGRYRNGGWTTWPLPDGVQNVQVIAAGPDGTVWLAGEQLARWDGRTWRVDPYPTQDAPFTWGGGAWVAPTPAGVIASGGLGTFRVGPAGLTLIPTGTTATPGPGYAQIMYAASVSDVWISDSERLWRWSDGTWSQPEGYLISPDVALIRTSSGRFAGVNQAGRLVVRDETRAGTPTWTQLSGDRATALVTGPDGRLWAIHREDGQGVGFSVRSYAEHSGTWDEVSRTPATNLIAEPRSIAAAPDGTIWIGSPGDPENDHGGVARYAAGRWEAVYPRGARMATVVNEVALGWDGSVWVAGRDNLSLSGAPWVARWFDGHWSDPFLGAYPDGDPRVAAGPDGSVWATGGGGLDRFDGAGRTTYVGGVGLWQVKVAPDGGVWVMSEAGLARVVPAPLRLTR